MGYINEYNAMQRFCSIDTDTSLTGHKTKSCSMEGLSMHLNVCTCSSSGIDDEGLHYALNKLVHRHSLPVHLGYGNYRIVMHRKQSL